MTVAPTLNSQNRRFTDGNSVLFSSGAAGPILGVLFLFWGARYFYFAR